MWCTMLGSSFTKKKQYKCPHGTDVLLGEWKTEKDKNMRNNLRWERVLIADSQN